MALAEQHAIDCEVRLHGMEVDRRSPSRAAAERAARESLRAQVARLERELSGIVAGCFPHVSPLAALDPARPSGWTGPHLLSLAELERLRDRLVVRVRGAQHQAVRQAELVRRSRDLLERMKEEPGRYKFVRLPVTDLGERGCGVWEVRPRLGLIGMLAGWWELKLSSGCPLRGPRAQGARLSRCRAARCHARLEKTAGGFSGCRAARCHARLEDDGRLPVRGSAVPLGIRCLPTPHSSRSRQRSPRRIRRAQPAPPPCTARPLIC